MPTLLEIELQAHGLRVCRSHPEPTRTYPFASERSELALLEKTAYLLPMSDGIDQTCRMRSSTITLPGGGYLAKRS